MSLKLRTFFYPFLLFLALVSLRSVFLDIPAVLAYECETPEQKVVCTNLLNQTQQEIDSLSNQLNRTKQQASSITRDKQILDIKIKQAKLQIKAHELSIANIGKDIVSKTKTIQTLQQKIVAGQESLGQILRKTNEIDDYSLPELFLGNEKLSDAFADLDSFDSVKTSMALVFTELTDAKQANEDAKVALGQQRDKEIDTRVNIETAKKKVEVVSAEKQRLLNLNQTEQKNYQKVIADKSAEIAKIKAALFKLRDSVAIPFGTALQYAKEASAKTGVRPAFVLAILTQESNLGSNVGSCYVSNLENGDGVGKNTGTAFEQVMKAPRDTVPFITITGALGRDWTKTPVSCPIGSKTYYKGRGFGGGMGPAQFIPSTWMLFQSRLSAALNTSAPDPWNPAHAFMASSMYLSDLGAAGGSYSGEIRAACKYYGSGGSSCTYGTQVMSKVSAIQANIDIIEGN